MGGRGSRYSTTKANKIAATAQQATPTAANQQNLQQSVQNQAPDATNTPVTPDALATLSNMTDQQLMTLMMSSKHVDMPNHLNDVGANDGSNTTQKFVFAAGLNGLPTVLDDAAFNQYMKDNHIAQSEILSRSTNGANYTVNNVHVRLTPQQVTDILKYSALNYVGGKHGGNVYGSGTYFDQVGGQNTGYAGGATVLAVLNPKTAKVITKSALKQKIPSFAASHPKFARAVGAVDYDNLSIYALAMGYNVIKADHCNYHNVIDRTALVYRKSNL